MLKLLNRNYPRGSEPASGDVSMAEEHRGRDGGASRGFASMDQDKQREIARKGGANVPHEKRSFAQDRELAAAAGRKGGRSVAPQRRSFAQNRALAAAAGRKGGQASQSRRISGQRAAESEEQHEEATSQHPADGAERGRR